MVESSSDILGCVLVMDDDLGRSAHRCAQLTLDGWQTLRASDLVEALMSVRSGRVDLVLLHVAADEAQELDLPSVLRRASQVPHLPVVVMAPEPRERTRCQFLDSGADHILPDAISPAELAARLRSLMRTKRLQDELQASRQALVASLARERELLTRLRRDNARLLTLCTTDPLTHLQNIRHFDAFLESQFRIVRRYRRRISVLMFDLDHFKVVNDNHGHPSGDYVLKEVAVILKRSVRDSDVVARTGGEEFSIILPDAGRADTRLFAQRIGATIRQRKFMVYGQQIHVTTSIGAASYPEDRQISEAQMLVYFADQALLRAKQLGRDRLVAFHQMPAAERRRLCEQYRLSRPEARRRERQEPLAAHAVNRAAGALSR